MVSEPPGDDCTVAAEGAVRIARGNDVAVKSVAIRDDACHSARDFNPVRDALSDTAVIVNDQTVS